MQTSNMITYNTFREIIVERKDHIQDVYLATGFLADSNTNILYIIDASKCQIDADFCFTGKCVAFYKFSNIIRVFEKEYVFNEEKEKEKRRQIYLTLKDEFSENN